jgi:pimeloyl-ACP methyl ester carboxylesterase
LSSSSTISQATYKDSIPAVVENLFFSIMLTMRSTLHRCGQTLLLGFLLFTTTARASVIIPKPSGPYGVSLRTMELTDSQRLDPFSPRTHVRNVMISAFYPGVSANQCSTRFVDYMPPATAAIEDQYYSQYGLPNGTFESLKLSLCKESVHTTERIQDFPIILFSPGLGNSRLLYSALAQYIASFGYLVVSIDHPYDANVVEYPDGTLILGANISTGAQIELAVETRAQDVSFILDQLSSVSTVQRLFPSIKGALKTHKVAMYGHSLGGATAAVVMLNDSRIIGGANLDGSFFGPILRHSLSRPFLIFGHEGKNQSTDASWNVTWSQLHGWKIELMLHGAQHATFSDLPLLAEILGLDRMLPPEAELLLGSIDGARALDILSKYLRAFFKFVQKGISSPLLQGPDKGYPEVSIVARGNGAQN